MKRGRQHQGEAGLRFLLTSWLVAWASAALSTAAPPPNDHFADATVIAGTTIAVSGSNVDATKEPGEPNHAGSGGGKSVWWSWTASADGSVRVSTEGSSVDTLLAIYTGDVVTSLVEVNSNDNRSDGDQLSEVFFYAQAGQTYRIVVDGTSGMAWSLKLKLDQVPGEGPLIWRHLLTAWRNAGSDAAFSVAATGAGTLNYQWHWGAEELLGETNANLVLRSVAASQAGEYWVRVSSSCGSVDSEHGELRMMDVRLGHEIGHWPMPGRGDAEHVQVAGTMAYLVEEPPGLIVSDMSNPSVPLIVGSYDTPGATKAVEVTGNLAFLADYDAGLHILDVSNPAAPIRLGGYASGSQASGTHVVGKLAYLAERVELQILDVSDPALPVSLGRYDTPGIAHMVEVVGQRAYVADGPAGWHVLDVSSPSQPIRLGG